MQSMATKQERSQRGGHGRLKIRFVTAIQFEQILNEERSRRREN